MTMLPQDTARALANSLGALETSEADARELSPAEVASLVTATAPAAEPMQEAQQAPCGNRDYCSRFPWCGCGGPDPLPERDPSKPSEQQGLFRKFDIRRTDGSDKTGDKHEGCEYFVLNVTHDQHAKAALIAYAIAIRATHPALADDLRDRYDLAFRTQPLTEPDLDAAQARAIEALLAIPGWRRDEDWFDRGGDEQDDYEAIHVDTVRAIVAAGLEGYRS